MLRREAKATPFLAATPGMATPLEEGDQVGSYPIPLPLDAPSRFPRQPLVAIDGSLAWATSVTPFLGETWLRERRITVTASTTSHAKKA
jgi:hypothetical protein